MKAMNMFKKMVCGLMAVIVMLVSIAPAHAAEHTTRAPELTVTNKASTGKPYLEWTKVANVERYNVWYKLDKPTDQLRPLFTTKGNHLTHSSAKAGVRYLYLVEAEVKDDPVAKMGNFERRTCDLARPTMEVAGGVQCPPSITWTHVDGAIGYEVWANHAGEGYKRIYSTKNGSHVLHRSAKKNSSYRYRVRAIHSNHAANSAYTPSKFVDTAVCTTAPGCPVLEAKCNPDSGKPVLTWNHVPCAINYEVYRTEKDHSVHMVGTTTDVSWVDTYATPGQFYGYMVRAIQEKADLSGDSNAINITCDFRRPEFEIRGDGLTLPRLVWDYHEGEEGMQVWCSDNGGGYKLLCTAKHGTLSHTSAEYGHHYRYRIRAVGKTSASASAYSYTRSVQMEG